MPAPIPGTPAYYQSRATPIPKKGAQKYFTFRQPPPDSGYAPGDVLKLGPNQRAQWNENLGWSAVAKPKVAVKKAVTPQGSLTTIESPAQIEARVKRLADENFARQQGVLDTHAAAMRKEAEGRRVALQNAYATAAQMNANLGSNIQGGWNEAARTIQGMANTGTGAVAEGLQGDLATQEQALSRVGAGGTGFDARSQAGVEAYRGGSVPGEFFARQGAAGNQWMNQDAQALNQRGIQEPIATENTERAKIEADYQSQLADLQTGRGDYETKLREQLLGARKDQLEAKAAADKAVADVIQRQATLDNQYRVARLSATTKKQLQQVEMIYKGAALDLKRQEGVALANQRNASAQASLAHAATQPALAAAASARANLANVKAADIVAHPGTGGGRAPKKPKTVQDIVKDAAGKIGQGGIAVPPRKTKTGIDVPYGQRLFEYLWQVYKDAVPKSKQAALKRQLLDLSKRAPRPTPRSSGGITSGLAD